MKRQTARVRNRTPLEMMAEKKTHKRVTRPMRRNARQPRFASPRSVNIEPESLRISRRGSGRWRSSSASGLSMLQFEGSADNENWKRKARANVRQSAPLILTVEACAVPCRPATWLTHRTVSHPKSKRRVRTTAKAGESEDERAGKKRSGNQGRE
jgi:hypothetical protein